MREKIVEKKEFDVLRKKKAKRKPIDASEYVVFAAMELPDGESNPGRLRDRQEY